MDPRRFLFAWALSCLATVLTQAYDVQLEVSGTLPQVRQAKDRSLPALSSAHSLRSKHLNQKTQRRSNTLLLLQLCFTSEDIVPKYVNSICQHHGKTYLGGEDRAPALPGFLSAGAVKDIY